MNVTSFTRGQGVWWLDSPPGSVTSVVEGEVYMANEDFVAATERDRPYVAKILNRSEAFSSRDNAIRHLDGRDPST